MSTDLEAQREEIASLRRQLEQLRSMPGNTDIQELHQLYEAIRLERDELEQKLAEKAAAVGETAALRASVAALQAELEAVRAARAHAEEQLDHAQNELRAQKAQATQAVLDKLLALEEELAATREERDALEIRLAERAGVSAETNRLREDLHLAQAALETAEAETAALRADMLEAEARADTLAQEKVSLATECQELEKLAEEKDAALAHLRKDFEGLRLRYEPLAQRLNEAEVEAEEALAAQVRLQGQVAQKKRLEQELADLAQRLESELDQRATARRQCLADLQGALADLVAQGQAAGSDELHEEIAALKNTCARLEQDRDAAREELRYRQIALETARRTLALQTAEMDALREAAASQVATASVQAGELEFYVGQLESALEISRNSGRDLNADLEQIAARFTGALAELEAAAQRVAALAELQADGAPPLRPDDRQRTFFDTEFFRYLPDDAPPEGSEE
ncbi:MAG: hypothetical protein IT368_02030 [Candidatus Hydrogenedentes bacterium]|nr:hypothetical protein [Candidatus Hydrogenedentota bacterium]